MFYRLIKLTLSCFSLLVAISLTQTGVFAQQDDNEIIKVSSSIVLMNATITDNSGKAVGGLGQQYFRIFEDGKEQEIISFAADETPFAAIILLDTSGSMEQRVTLARSAAIQFLDGIRNEDVVSIYNFDSKFSRVQDFSNSRDIREQIFDLKADGMTILNDAVFKAAELLAERPEKRRAIVILSDGADTMSRKSADKALQAASEAGATIYSVDMSSMTDKARDRLQNQSVLKKFAEKTGGQFVATPGGVAMRETFKRIVEELGSQYTLAFEPANDKKDGKWRSLELRVAKPNLTVRTRKGYNAPKGK